MSDFIEPLRRRLVELGCPIARAQRLVREVADHREDLKQAALAEGLSETDAEARANAQLGNPLVLAEQTMAALRQSSWWGRHSVMSFCVVPLLAFPVLWLLLLVLELALGFALGYGWDPKKLPAADNPVGIHHLNMVALCSNYIAIALVSLFFCWLARRSAVSFKWTVTACAICSLYALFTRTTIKPHLFAVGVSWTPHWIEAAIPLLIAGAVCAFQWRTRRRFQEKVTV